MTEKAPHQPSIGFWPDPRSRAIHVDSVYSTRDHRDVNDVNIDGVLSVIIDTQAANTLLTTLGISVGVVIVLAAVFLAVSAGWRRYDRKGRLRSVEQYLAAVARRPHGTSRARSR